MNELSHTHHFSPVFYTKRWASTVDGKLVAWSRPYKEKIVQKRTYPDATGFQENLNKFDGLPPEIQCWFEDVFLKHTDDFAAKALSKLESGKIGRLTKDDVCGWVRFLISLRCRHPDPFEELKQTVRYIWEYHLNNTEADYEKLKHVSDPMSHAEFIASITEEERTKACVQLLKGAIDNEVAGNRLTHMDWAVLDLRDATVPLLTSDWPVLFSLGAPVPHLIVPIGPFKLFVATADKQIIEHLQRSPPDRLVSDVNRHSIRRARRFVFGSDNSHSDLIKDEMGCDVVQPPFFPTARRMASAASSQSSSAVRAADAL